MNFWPVSKTLLDNDVNFCEITFSLAKKKNQLNVEI